MSNERTTVQEKLSVEELSAALAEMTEQCKRAMADYANLQRQVAEERQAAMTLATSIVVGNLLPVLDNLAYAAQHSADEGLGHVSQQFAAVFAAQGVEEISAEGALFDPSLHEAVETVLGDEDDRIVEVLTKGYTLQGAVLRPAQVVVSTTSKEQENERTRKQKQRSEDHSSDD